MTLKKYFRRAVAIIPSVLICALGVNFFILADFGSDPLTTFEIGLSNVLGIQLGSASLLFEGSIFIIFFIFRRKFVNIGTAIWCLMVGPFINFFTFILQPIVIELGELSLFLRIIFMLIGTILIVLSLAYYIPINLGYAANDVLAFAIVEKLNCKYGSALTFVSASLFIIGVIMNAPWGIGTLVSILFLGKLIDFTIPYTKKITYFVCGMETKK